MSTFSKPAELYLASSSPRRRELLQQIGVSFQPFSVDVCEAPKEHELPDVYVQRLSQAKAAAGWQSVLQRSLSQGMPHKPVLGADTSVIHNGRILGKPEHFDDYLEKILSLAGSTHQVLSSVTVTDGERIETCMSKTEVRFSVISLAEAKAYWASGEPQDKAGGYGIQGLGAVFVQHISGSYSGVVGLPLEKTVELLRSFRVPFGCFQP